MSAVVYRAPDRELNLNESDKSRWGNTQTPIAGLCVGEAKRRRDRVKKHSQQTVNQVQKDGLGLGFFFSWWKRVSAMIKGAMIFLFLTFLFMTTAFIDKEDLLEEIHGKWRRCSLEIPD